MPTETARRPRLSERIRLIRILRTHGLRAVERLRADELRAALEKLGLTLNADEERPAANAAAPAPASATSSVSSSEMAHAREESTREPPSEDAPTEEAPMDTMVPRFREPDAFLPVGERTFVRLIAVDWNHLYATWDVDASTRSRLGGDDARLFVRVADASSNEPGAVLFDESIRVSAKGWYLRAPEPRLRVVAALCTPGGEVLAVSNACVVPPNHPAPPGPLRFATVPISVDRRRLRGGQLFCALIDEATELPEDVVVEEAGRVVRARVPRAEEESAPSSGAKQRVLSQGGPTLPVADSAPSSWRSAPSSSASSAPSSSGGRR